MIFSGLVSLMRFLNEPEEAYLEKHSALSCTGRSRTYHEKKRKAAGLRFICLAHCTQNVMLKQTVDLTQQREVPSNWLGHFNR